MSRPGALAQEAIRSGVCTGRDELRLLVGRDQKDDGDRCSTFTWRVASMPSITGIAHHQDKVGSSARTSCACGESVLCLADDNPYRFARPVGHEPCAEREVVSATMA